MNNAKQIREAMAAAGVDIGARSPHDYSPLRPERYLSGNALCAEEVRALVAQRLAALDDEPTKAQRHRARVWAISDIYRRRGARVRLAMWRLRRLRHRLAVQVSMDAAEAERLAAADDIERQLPGLLRRERAAHRRDWARGAREQVLIYLARLRGASTQALMKRWGLSRANADKRVERGRRLCQEWGMVTWRRPGAGVAWIRLAPACMR